MALSYWCKSTKDKCSVAHKNMTKWATTIKSLCSGPLSLWSQHWFQTQKDCFIFGVIEATHPRGYLCCQAPSSHCTQRRDSSSCLKPEWNQNPASSPADRQNNDCVCERERERDYVCVCMCISVDVYELQLHRCEECRGELNITRHHERKGEMVVLPPSSVPRCVCVSVCMWVRA